MVLFLFGGVIGLQDAYWQTQETAEKKENKEIESLFRKAEKLLMPLENATRKEDFDFDTPLTGKDEARLGTLLEEIETQVTEMKEAEIEIFHDAVSLLIELKEGIQILLPDRYAEFRAMGRSLTRRGWKLPPGFWDK